MVNSRTDLYLFVQGSITDQRYIEDFLLPYVRVFRGGLGEKSHFIDDKSTWHHTQALQYSLGAGDIHRIA